MPYLIQCNTCKAASLAPHANDPDSEVECDCCLEDHHHGQAANETGKPCRPITIVALPGTTHLRHG